MRTSFSNGMVWCGFLFVGETESEDESSEDDAFVHKYKEVFHLNLKYKWTMQSDMCFLLSRCRLRTFASMKKTVNTWTVYQN